jgi:hypothetical protein
MKSLNRKQALLVATIVLVVLSLSMLFAFAASTILSANLGTNSVPAATSNDVISAASYNGNAPTSGVGTTSVTFPASTVASTATLSLTVKNTGQGTSTIPQAGIVASDGDSGAALSFTLTAPTTFPVSLAAGASQVFTWTVTDVNAGSTTIQTTPTVTITPTS